MSFKDVYKSAILKADMNQSKEKDDSKEDSKKSEIDAKAQQIIDDHLAKSRVLKTKSK